MLRCPACSTEIPPTAIRPARSVALCPSCDASVQLAGSADDGWEVIGFQEPMPPEGLELIGESTAESGYRDSAGASGWAARLGWRRGLAWYPALMAIGAVLGVVPVLFGPHRQIADHMPFAFQLPFLTIWPVAGVLFGWWALALLRNRTTIRVEKGVVSCDHGPVPVVREKSRPVPLGDVELFEVERRDPPLRAKNLVTPTWTVVARLIGGQRVPVVTRLPEERHARWLQRKLDTMLA